MRDETVIVTLRRLLVDSAHWGHATRVREMAGRVGTSFREVLDLPAGALIFRRPSVTPMETEVPYRVVHTWGLGEDVKAATGGEGLQREFPGLAEALKAVGRALAEGRLIAGKRFRPVGRLPRAVRAEVRRLGIEGYGTWTFRAARTDGAILLGQRPYDPEVSELVSLAVLQVAIILDLLAERRAAESLARIDTLTGLWNRRGVEDQVPTLLAAARRHGERLVVTVVDVDDLKLINDTEGHTAGDSAIRAVAGALRASVRQSDVVGRWGGDEFVVISSQQHPMADRVARRLMDVVGNATPTVRVSAGAAVWGEDGETWDAVFSAADTRCYAEKLRHHVGISDIPRA